MNATHYYKCFAFMSLCTFHMFIKLDIAKSENIDSRNERQDEIIWVNCRWSFFLSF